MNLPVKRELTEKQEIFLNKLFENGGNISKATVDSGYSKYSRKWLSKTLRQEIINRCETELATHGPKWRKLKKDLKNYTNKVRKAVFHKD